MDDKNRNYQQNRQTVPQATVFSALDRSTGSRISEEGKYSLEHTSEAVSRVVENEPVPVSIYEGGNRFLGTRLRKQIVAIGVSAVVALTAAFGLVVANMLSGGKEPVQQPLTSLSSEDLRGVSSDISGGIGQITVNSPLLVNSKLTVTPSARPTVSQAGELYFDAETNRFMYYDGSSYQQIVNDQEFSQLSAIARSDAGTGLSLVGGVLSNAGVLSLQGQTGNVSFTAGSGVSLNGTQIANTGVLSIQGQSGNVSFTAGTGISLNGMAITNSGVTALSGTPGQVAVSGANGSVTISLPQSIATISSPTFQGLTLATALGLNSGGTGATASNFSPRGVVFYNGSHLVGTASPASDGLCLVSTSSGPAFSSCSGTASVTSVNNFSGAITISAGSGITLNESAGTITVSALAASGVMSLQGLSGALTLANASASGSTITINNASTAQKGIASFNSSTFSVNNGNVSLVTCANDQILKYSTTASSWGCADDVDTDTGDGQGVTAISAGDGITVNANNPATPTVAIKLQPGMGLSLNSSTGLGLLNTCSAGQVLKYSSTSSAWECASDAVGTGDGQGVTSIEAGDASLAIDSSDSSAPVLSVRLYSNRGIVLDTVNGLGLKACADGQVLKYNGGQWICADDSDTATPGDGVGITSITAGDGIEVTPSSTSPTVAIKLQSGMGLSLNSTTGLGLLNTCSAGQVLKYNGNAWECSDDVDTSDGQGVTSVTATDASIVINNSDASAPKLSVRIHNNKGIVLDAANGLGLMACANDQILKYSTATNSWGCADDVDTNTGDGQGVVDIIAGDGINVLDDDVAPTVSIKLQPGMGLALNSTTGLGLLNTCSSGQVLKYNNSQWQCDDDIDTQGGGDGQGVTSVEAGDASIVIGGDNSVAPELSVRLHSNRGIVLDAANGLGLRACADGEVLKYSGSQWICGTDNDTVAPGDGVGITSITAGSGIEVTPSSTSPTVAIKLQSGMGLALNGATGLGLLNTCSAGQILKYNGSAWECNDDIDTDTQDGQGVTSIAATDASIVIDSSNPASPKLSVRLQNNKGIELNPTTGLGLIACANDQVLKYSTDTSSWGCASDASGSGVTGTGTAGRLVKFTGAGAVGDSVLGESGDTITLQASGATAALTANTALSVTAGGTNQNLVLNASGSGQVQIGGTSTGDILLGGGSGSTGCTVANASGNFTCAGSFNTTGQYQINGVQISSADLSNDNNLAKLNASNIFTGQANTFNSDAATQNALLIAANSLTSGSGLKVTTASTSLTSGNLVDISQTSAYDSTFTTSSKLLNVSRTVTGAPNAVAPGLDTSSTRVQNCPASFCPSPITWSHTVTSTSTKPENTNRALIVSVSVYNNVTVSGITYNGQPLSRLATVTGNGPFFPMGTTQWVLVNPPTGTHEISLDVSSSSASFVAIASSWYNVDQTTPVAQNLTSTNGTVTVNANSKQMVVDVINYYKDPSGGDNPPSPGSGQTVIATPPGSFRVGERASYKLGASTMSWSGGDYAGAMIATVLNPVTIFGSTDGTLSGSVANISSACAGCTETGSILNLQQSNTAATGAVLAIQNAGTGPDIQLGNGVIRVGADSATAMRMQNADGSSTLFTANTTDNRITIGDSAGAATLLVLDSAAAAPTGVNGGMFYDTTDHKFKFYQNGAWTAFGTGNVSQSAFTASRIAQFDANGNIVNSILDGSTTNTITLQTSTATALLNSSAGLTIASGGTGQLTLTSASGTIGTTSDIQSTANIEAANFNATGGYSVDGTAGLTSLSCQNGEVLQNATIIGGIVTGGTCATVSAGDVYLANNNPFTGTTNSFTSNATTQNALLIAANNLTSGSGLKVTTASTSLTNGNLVDITQTSAYDSTFNTSSKLLNVSRTVTGPLSRGTVTLDSTSQYNSSSPSTWNHTVADHENDILIVTIGGTRSYNCCNIEYPSSVTYGGQPMTRVTAAMYPDDFNVASVSQWVMYDPPTGTHLISVTASDFYFATTGLAASYYNVDQDNPIASIVQTNDVYPPTFAVSASAEQAVIDGLNSNRTYNTFATQNPNTSGQIKTGEATFGPASGSSGTHISLATKLTTSYAIGPKTTMGWTGEGYNAYVAIVLNAAMVPGATDGTLSGSVANISSDCAGCTETGNILNLQQSNVSATGAVLNIQNAGAGPDIQLGNGIIRAGADSTTAMRIQNASGNNTLFTADTTNDRIVIGDGSSTATALVLDSAASAPTGVNGAMYYDTTEGKFKFYQNGEWVSFGTEGGGGATLQQAYNASVTATPSSPATILTSGPNNGILVKAGASADSTSLFRVQNAGSVTLLNVDSVVGTVTLTGTSSADALSVVGGTSIAGNLKVTQTSSNAVIQFTTTPSNTSSTTTVGPNSPTVGVNDASAGSGAWSSPSNALTNNGATAVATMNSTGSTNYLKLTGFGFSIPSDAQIAGVTVDVKAQTNNQSGAMDVRLVDNGTPTGSVVTYNGIISSVTSDYYTVGSSSSTWGNALTPAKINSSNFGIAIQYRHDMIFGTQTLSIDHARVTIYYRAGGNLVSRTWTVGQAQNGTGEFRIAASSALGTNDYFKIDALTGNVGIGTVAPIQNKLGVNGSIGAAGSITASSTPDIAETIPAADDVEPGDVVSADPDHSVRAIKSQTSYDSTMIGIISDGTSAFKINSHAGDEAAGATGKYLVLAGRIPVKVTNEGGPIKPGDYLTSSSTPGYAMKATKAGPTVGKALASFDGETGTVMVHANLSYYEPPIATVDIQGQTATFHEINISGMATINTLHVTSSLTVDGDIIVGGHVVTNGNTPDVEALIAAGSNAAVEINGNDTSGTITLTTGANPSAGNLARIMFNKPYGKAPKILISAANDAAADLRFYRGTTTTDDTLLRTKDTPGANTTYQYDYFIAE